MTVRLATILAVAAGLLFTAPPARAGESKEAKARREAAEGAAAFERAMTFYRQGAYKEAEKEFRTAEKKTDNKNVEYVLATADNYLKLHKPDDAQKRYEKLYKQDPKRVRALAGMAESYEEMQNYREAVRIWKRYVKATLTPAQLKEGQRRLAAARKLFAERYEIAENPAGGAPNLATPDQEAEWGLGVANQVQSSGIPQLQDPAITPYVKTLCKNLVDHAKNFPTNYQVFVLDSATVNAFTTPGYIFVFRGILDASDSEAALAGVLGHEIGHSLAHHVGKSTTRAYKDEEQAKSLKASKSKLSRALGSLLEAGNPIGQLTFSRENEAQADRLGVHIAYDAGYDPRGLISIFQKFESMSPSSRKSWDLMARTHPFSIDRLNAVEEYAALLPDRPKKPSSPAFVKMKARLKAMPLAPDATGQLIDSASSGGSSTPSAPASKAGSKTASKTAPVGTKSYTLNGQPFKGEFPGDWRLRNGTGGVIFEGEEGTEAFQMTVQLEVAQKDKLMGQSIDDLARHVRDSLQGKQDARVEQTTRHKTSEGRDARATRASYTAKNAKGTTFPYRHVNVIVDYPGHYLSLSYYGINTLFDKYMDRFELIGAKVKYTGE